MADSDERNVPVAREVRRPDALAQIVRAAQEALRTDFAGITLLRADGGFDSRGVTDPIVGLADQLQDKFGEGPCVEVTLEARTVLSIDVADDPRWPRWGPAVRDLGLCSVLSAELRAHSRRIGALNLYGGTPREFTSDEVALAHLYARQAAVKLAADGEP